MTTEATRAAVTERERADDRQLVHAVRAMDDCERTANELAERLAEWAGTIDPDAGTGVEYAREVASGEAGDALTEPAVRSLAERVADLATEADDLREFVQRRTPAVAPNLAALADPVLAARLISLAGGLEELAKKPSGTVQVLGAEDALFAHLRGHAPSPKHGIIYTHDAVRGTHPDERGSAARAVAGKLAIAARVDHYSGDLKPELEAELTERIETIQARNADGDSGDEAATDGGVDDE
ncbi:Pre-mRNA processing ribonucleoprotein, binding domain protein [Natrinema thermotolerans DSM 11552]|nr:Pre-mRNA processing ribonucleoprotein, binding domain protein [Natrinema thermotolerans DSM 11552]